MKKVLLPVDFSEVSINAIEYAMEYTSPMDRIEIVHVTMGMLDLQEPIQMEESKEEIILKSLEKYILANSKYNVLPARCHLSVKIGVPVETIVRESSKGYDYIIMGTRDKYDLLERWFGTISLGVVKRVKVPVLLIPRHSKYTGLQKVVLASDHHLMDKKLLDRIRKWNKKRKAFIKFLHVKTNPKDDYEKESDTIIREYFSDNEVNFGFEIELMADDRIGDSLLSCAYNFHADMLMVIPDAQSYLESLLFQSVSKEMVLKSTIPVYFIHL